MKTTNNVIWGNSSDALNFGPLDEVVFDRKSGQYLNRKTRQPVDREQLFELTRANIAVQQRELMALADQLADKKLSLLNFQFQAAELLRRIHTQSAVLGRGGKEKMKPADWLRVGRELARQYYSGKDKDGKRFGLKHLTKDIKNGDLSLGQLRNSLRLYSESGKASFWQAAKATEKEQGRTFAVRSLGIAEHCTDCLRYAAMPPQPIDDIILPTQQCACMNNCKCKIIPLTLEQAVARGLVVNLQESVDFGNPYRDAFGRFAKKSGHSVAQVKHAAEHLGENVAAWKTGKVLGGAIANIAAAHGVQPELARLISESTVQSLTATAIYASKGKRTPRELAEKFVAETAAAFVGKMAHTGVDDALLGGDEEVRQIAALFAGKASGIATNSGVSRFLKQKGERLKTALARSSDYSDRDLPVRDDVGLTDDELESIFALSLAGYFSNF